MTCSNWVQFEHTKTRSERISWIKPAGRLWIRVYRQIYQQLNNLIETNRNRSKQIWHITWHKLIETVQNNPCRLRSFPQLPRCLQSVNAFAADRGGRWGPRPSFTLGMRSLSWERWEAWESVSNLDGQPLSTWMVIILTKSTIQETNHQ